MAPDQPPRTTLKLIAQHNQPIHFSYAPQKGLNLSGTAGGILSENILGKLLAIPDGDIDAHIAFFTDYGFLYPVSETEYEAVEADALMEPFVNRIKAAVALVNSIAAKKKLLHKYSDWHRTVSYMRSNYSTLSAGSTVPVFTNLRISFITTHSFLNMQRNQEVFDTKNKFSVEDTLFPPSYQVDIGYFN